MEQRTESEMEFVAFLFCCGLMLGAIRTFSEVNAVCRTARAQTCQTQTIQHGKGKDSTIGDILSASPESFRD